MSIGQTFDRSTAHFICGLMFKANSIHYLRHRVRQRHKQERPQDSAYCEVEDMNRKYQPHSHIYECASNANVMCENVEAL